MKTLNEYISEKLIVTKNYKDKQYKFKRGQNILLMVFFTLNKDTMMLTFGVNYINKATYQKDIIDMKLTNSDYKNFSVKYHKTKNSGVLYDRIETSSADMLMLIINEEMNLQIQELFDYVLSHKDKNIAIDDILDIIDIKNEWFDDNKLVNINNSVIMAVNDAKDELLIL